MKKNILCLMLLLFSVRLVFSLRLISENKETEISIEQLSAYNQIEISTSREKDGVKKTDAWQGVSLSFLLEQMQIKDFDLIKLSSADNYMIRVSKEELEKFNPVIALKRNGKAVDHGNRFVADGMRDMYWIYDIATIQLEKNSPEIIPSRIFIAENVFDDLRLINEPGGFAGFRGYFLIELLERTFGFIAGEVFVKGKDGVSHNLEFTKYLKDAVILKNEENYDIKSPQMPAGMWVKSAFILQNFDQMILFAGSFQEITDYLIASGWQGKLVINYKDNRKVETELNRHDEILLSEIKFIELLPKE